MAKVVIADTGNPGLDGEHELDVSYFTNRELHLLKREANVRAGEVKDALLAGDNDLAVVFAHIALQRSGKHGPIDVLWDLPAGNIRVDFSDQEEAAADPPAQSASGNGDELPPAEKPSSGESSERSSENPDSDPSSTGTPPSETPSRVQGYQSTT